MADAYKCENCGEVMTQLGNCPSCGGNRLRPTRVPESELPSNDGPGDEWETSDTDEATTDDPTGGSRERDETRRERTDDQGQRGGLLAWLKSLF